MCTRNRRFMAKHCLKSCGWCEEGADAAAKRLCSDEDIKCETWAHKGECTKNVAFMNKECARSCKACARRPDESTRTRPAAAPATASTTAKASASKPSGTESAAAPDATNCEDRDQRCSAWANAGMCKTNPSIMLRTCPVACSLPECGRRDERQKDEL